MRRQHLQRPAARWRVAALLVAVLTLAAGSARGQETMLPASVEASLLLKILTFDREMAARTAGGLVIGVLYQEKFRTSLLERDEMVQALSAIDSLTIGGRNVHVTAVSIDADRDNVASALAAQQVDVLYVTPLRAADIRAVAAACREAKVPTFSGVAAYTRDGLAVGLGMRREKAEIYINVAAARAEGCDYRAQLLAMATIVE
jgi:hypothetical protein